VKNGITITGMEQVYLILNAAAPNEARNLLRTTATGMVKEVAVDAEANAPEDTGNLRGAIMSKRQRDTPTKIMAMAGVRVSGTKGAFYWRFEEYGQGATPVAHAYFLRAAEKLRAGMHERFLRVFGKKLENRLARLRKKAG